MTNEQMIAGRFLALAKARRRYNFIVRNLAAGNSVSLTTQTRSTNYRPKHIDMFKIKGKDVFVQRGKSWDCINYVKVTAFGDNLVAV